jgi:23S rRNA (uracil747-C5)-methyltransferase
MVSPYEDAQCPYFSASTCNSCGLLGVSAGKRLSTKESRVHATLRARGIIPEHSEAIRTVQSPWGSRCKTKVSVTGSLDAPVLGIVRSDLSTQDLSECPLPPRQVQQLLTTLKDIIKDAKLTPYAIRERTGELKHIIVTHNHDATQGILRFILRSSESIPRIAKCLSAIQSAHPWVTVISCNVQPIPAALLEGPDETVLTPTATMQVLYNDTLLSFMPQSFIQVTHEIAAALYHRAATYVRENSFSHALDLFCGVGGFSLSIASSVRKITGVEVSPMAVQSAQDSASLFAISHASFIADDVESFLKGSMLEDVDLIIVNPPRRGLSPGIRQALLNLAPQSILYSSCDPETFARDIEDLSLEYSLKVLAPFDMFPLTDHCEVLGILERK